MTDETPNDTTEPGRPPTSGGQEPLTGQTQINFRAGEIAPELAARSARESEALTARRDLGRYYALLRMALAGVRARRTFSEAEAGLLCEVAMGTRFEEHSMTWLWADVADAIRLDQIDKKWAVDGRGVVRKLQDLTPLEAVAVLDACERFWSGEYRKRGPLVDRLRAVGLVVSPEDEQEHSLLPDAHDEVPPVEEQATAPLTPPAPPARDE